MKISTLLYTVGICLLVIAGTEAFESVGYRFRLRQMPEWLVHSYQAKLYGLTSILVFSFGYACQPDNRGQPKG